MRTVLRALSAIWPAMLGGASFLLCASFAMRQGGSQAFGAMLFGAFAGLLTLGLIRLFPVARWAYPFVGALVGPLPALATYARSGKGEQEAAAIWILGALFGALIGLLEWARQSRLRESGWDGVPGE